MLQCSMRAARGSATEPPEIIDNKNRGDVEIEGRWSPKALRNHTSTAQQWSQSLRIAAILTVLCNGVSGCHRY